MLEVFGFSGLKYLPKLCLSLQSSSESLCLSGSGNASSPHSSFLILRRRGATETIGRSAEDARKEEEADSFITGRGVIGRAARSPPSSGDDDDDDVSSALD